MDIQDKLERLPPDSGVYLFRDEYGRIIYVGKAASLRSRVRQYFHEQDRGESPLRLWLRQSIRDVDYILVNSPVEALVLEANLIKRHRPFFNVQMKDDKRYPCLELTIYEAYPRMRVVRKTGNKKSRYFGPFTDARAMRRVFKLVQRAFRIRTCKYDIDKPLARPCLDFHIGLCDAPCTRSISAGAYADAVLSACRFLDGRSGEIMASLGRDLEKCSSGLQFEKCARIRDLMASIDHVTGSRHVVTSPGDDGDFIGVATEGRQASVALLQVRDGKVLGQQRYNLETPLESGEEEILFRFIQQYYRPGFYIPPLICTQPEPAERDHLKEWLCSLAERRVELRNPRRGGRKELTMIAAMNAADNLKAASRTGEEKTRRNAAALESLQGILNLPHPPRRIEGFDISNISGVMSAASMVVFVEGEPLSGHYRRFKIMAEGGPDDFGMIREAVARRLRNLKVGGLESFRERPDLILIDGGKGQLSAALSAAVEEGLADIPIASLAKEREEIFVPGIGEPLPAGLDSPGLMLLQRVRDEAHRFALSYHRQMRSAGIQVSILDEIPGISKKRKETLLQSFDSIDSIRKATLYELQELPGFNRKVAESVLRFLGTAK
jgi:excinuclease ABC subunit C